MTEWEQTERELDEILSNCELPDNMPEEELDRILSESLSGDVQNMDDLLSELPEPELIKDPDVEEFFSDFD